MTLVLVSHVRADAEAAARLARALEEAGHQAAAQRPGDPDRDSALARCGAVVLLVSREALASEQMTPEVVGASERGLPIVPVLSGVSHLDLATRQPVWRTAIGSATAIEVPPDGLDAVLPRVVEGVRAVTAPTQGRTAPGGGSRRRTALAGTAVAVVLALAAGVWWAVSRDGGDEGGAPAAGPTTSSSTPASPTASPTATVPPADSATTPVASVAGNLRITAVRLVRKFCAGPTDQDCARAEAGTRLVVLTVEGWDGAPLPYTEKFAHQMDQAHVRSGASAAGFTKAQQSPDQSSWEIAYVPVPASAREQDLLLRWPGNPTILLHPAGG